MQFGFGAPVSGPLSGPRDLARIVSEGEAIGYDYCTIRTMSRSRANWRRSTPIPTPASSPAGPAATATSN